MLLTIAADWKPDRPRISGRLGTSAASFVRKVRAPW
jgi:hypothetical protein